MTAREVPARPWIPPTQKPWIPHAQQPGIPNTQKPLVAITPEANTTNSNISEVTTTVASTSIEATTAPTLATETVAAPLPTETPTTLPPISESIALDEPSEKPPDDTNKAVRNGHVHDGNGGRSGEMNSTTPTDSTPVIEAMQQQPSEGNIEEVTREPSADAIPSAFPVEEIPTETSTPPPYDD